MKVLHIDTGRTWRGGQRQAVTLHQGLLSNNIKSYLLTPQDSALHQLRKNDTANIFSYDYRSPYSLTTYRQINAYIKKIDPDLIHCHDSHAVTLGGRYHRKFPIFHTRRVSYPIKWLSRLFKYRNINMHICVSEDIRRYMNLFFNNTITIHSCVDLSRFQTLPSSSPFNKQGQQNLLYVGAFSEQKGIDTLLKAFAHIYAKHPNAVLHLVGDGHLFPQMQSLIHELDISDRTILYGSRSDIEPFYLSSDLVVCPSVSGEGSSGVIKEGMAAGKTVIASSLEANSELIDDQINGILFTNRDHDHLAQQLDTVLSQKVSISKQAILDKVVQFSCETTVQQYIQLYQETTHYRSTP